MPRPDKQPHGRIEFYKDGGKWYWRFVGDKGKTLAACSQGYTKKKDMEACLLEVFAYPVEELPARTIK